MFEVLCCGTIESKSKKIDNCTDTFISKNLKWPIFLYKLFIFLIKNKNKYNNSIFHIHRPYFAPALFLIKKRKIILTIHTKTFHVITSKAHFLRYFLPILKYFERLILVNFVHTVSVAGYEARRYYKSYSLNYNDLIYLPPPLIFHNNPIEKYNKKKLVLIVGRLSSVKRPLSVVELIANAYKFNSPLIKEYKFLFIGDGELRCDLVSKIKSFGLEDSIDVKGSVNYDKVQELFSKCKKSILLSESEINPYVVKESLYHGKPVFVTNVGDVQEYFTKEYGVIIPVENPESRVNDFINFLKKKYSETKIKHGIKKFILSENLLFKKNLKKIYDNS